MSDDLLPCPFCGNSNLNLGSRYAYNSSIREPAVRCSGCGIQGPAVTWNRRATPPEVAEWKQAASVEAGLRREFAAEVSALRKALEEMRTRVYARQEGFIERGTSLYRGLHIAEELGDIGIRIDRALAPASGGDAHD